MVCCLRGVLSFLAVAADGERAVSSLYVFLFRFRAAAAMAYELTPDLQILGILEFQPLRLLGAAAKRLGSLRRVSGRCYTRCCVQWIAIGKLTADEWPTSSTEAQTSVLQASSLERGAMQGLERDTT